MMIYFTPVLQATDGYYIGHSADGATHSVSEHEIVMYMAEDMQLGTLMKTHAVVGDYEEVMVYVDR